MAGSVKNTASIDENRVPTLIGVSSATTTLNGVDFITGITPVPIAVDPITHAVIVEAV